jgi:Flp pilus assembly protein TadG
MQNSTNGKNSHSKGQGMAEFGLALPILLLVIFGLLEVGRALFMYAAVTNASREAVRFATAYGVNETNVLHIQNCAAIRNTARRVAFLMQLEDSDIVIEYDTGADPVTGIEPAPFDTCDAVEGDATNGVDTGVALVCADRVKVTVTYVYQPIVPIVPQITTQTFTSSSARTFLGVIELDADAAECK